MLAGAVVAGGGKVVYSSWIDAQIEKNNLLKKEIVKLDAEIADIQDLENRKQRLVARMEIIEKLQRKRPEIVHQFDELVHTVPDGVYLTSIKQTGNKARDSRRRPVEHPRLDLHAQHRHLDLDGQPASCRWSRRPRTRRPADRASRCSRTPSGVDLEEGGETTVKKAAKMNLLDELERLDPARSRPLAAARSAASSWR